MLTYILLGIAVLVVTFLIVAAMQPSAFAITRSLKMSASPDAIFTQVNDLHKWQDWSPWAKLDPDAKIAYEGPVAGVSAGFTWNGNNKVGEGRMTVIESNPGNSVKLRLEFLRPMRATNLAEFKFKSEGGKTDVVWTMTGNNGFMGKAFGLVVNCDKMVGGDFERGLAQLAAVVESKK